MPLPGPSKKDSAPEPVDKAADVHRREFVKSIGLLGGGGVAGAAALRALQTDTPQAPSAPAAPSIVEAITAKSLGAAGDGTGDDGAVLTAAIKSLVGTLANRQSTSPLAIDFGDGRFVYNLETPIVVQQNHVRLLGNGAILKCQSPNAIVGDHASSANILFGFTAREFILKGRVSGDAIIIKSGSQCIVKDIRNYASVGGAMVSLLGTFSSRTSGIKSDSEFGAACQSVVSEGVYQKTLGRFFNCIANRHADLLGYGCSGAGVHLNESESFVIGGDFEKCGGPAVDLLNSRFGTVSIYTEVNGQRSSGGGEDTPDDIRIRSAPGALISRSSNIAVIQSMCGGAPVGGRTPNNVHIVSADDCLLVNNFLGGNVAIESGSTKNRVGMQARFIGQLINRGQETISLIG